MRRLLDSEAFQQSRTANATECNPFLAACFAAAIIVLAMEERCALLAGEQSVERDLRMEGQLLST